MNRTRTEQGFFVDYSQPFSAGSRHRFCGPNDVHGAACPNCKRPLLLFLHLDTSDDRLELAHWGGPLPLLFCWKCQVAQAPFYYHWNGVEVSILRFGGGPEE